MQTLMGDPYLAAQHLLSKLKAPAGTVSISTFKPSDTAMSLRVFLKPESRYLKRDIPDTWEGFTVFCEVAETPQAGRN